MSAPHTETRPLSLVENWDALPSCDDTAPGMLFGPFRLIRLLGRGGMGQVWLARQLSPVDREVAIKLQSDRLGEGINRAYFLVERQAMARMVHPYIAQLYDAGDLADGSVFFAMEYVNGMPLDRWLMAERRTESEFISLMIMVCEGMSYAHQRGLLHRDLKPGNLLVTRLAGGKDIPKVIDFGLALGVDSESGYGSDQMLAGTRAFMSPEQFRPPANGLDARVDVFALGVILGLGLRYLLDQSETVFSAGSEHLRSTLDQRRISVASTPGAPPKAGRPLPRELREIVRKAIAADRDQRYGSAQELADELHRYQSGHPVRAVQGGPSYVARCFVRRHRWAAALSTLAFAGVVGGTTAAIWGYVEASAQRAVAEERREQADALVRYMLGELADKLRPIGRLELLESVSQAALSHLSAEPAGRQRDPIHLIRNAQTFRTLAEVEQSRGQPAAALLALERADSLLDLAQLSTQSEPELWFERGQVAFWLGALANAAGDSAGAEAQWLRYADAADTLASLRPGRDSEIERGYALNNLAVAAFNQGDFERAAERFAQYVELKRKLMDGSAAALTDLSTGLSWLARSYGQARKLNQALEVYQQELALALQMRALDPQAAAYREAEGRARQWVARSALELGDSDRAATELRRAIVLFRELVSFDTSRVEWRRYHLSALIDLVELQSLAVTKDEFARELEQAADAVSLQDPEPLRRLQQRARVLFFAQRRDATGLDEVLAQLGEPTSAEWRQVRNFALIHAASLGRDIRTEALLQPDLERATLLELEQYVALGVWSGRADTVEPARLVLEQVGYRHPRFLSLINDSQRP